MAAMLTLPVYSQNYRKVATKVNVSRSAENIPAVSDPGYKLAPTSVRLSPDETVPVIPPANISTLKPKSNGEKTLNVTAEPPGTKIGYTYYDFQTNATIQERLVYTPESDAPTAEKYVQMVWMASKDSTRTVANPGQPGTPGFNDKRGAHYAVINVGNPDSPVDELNDWKKVDGTTRTGWPAIVRYNDINKGIGIVSHTPVQYWGNGGFGNDKFTAKATADGNTSWPRLASDNKDYLHVLYNFNTNADNTGDNQVGYRRSTDGGSSWSVEKFFTGASAEGGNFPKGNGGDSYAITARGSKVVAMYLDNALQLIFRESTDNGDTWSAPLVVFNPSHTDLDTVDIAGTDSVTIHTDTIIAAGNHFDVIIDNEGKANFVFNEILTYVVRKAVKQGATLTAAGGIIYTLDSLVWYRDNNLGLRFWRQGDTQLYIMGKPAGSSFTGEGEIVSRRAQSGLSRYPQLGIDADNKVYLVYTSVKSDDFTDVQIDNSSPKDGIADGTVKGLFGHIYLTHCDATRSVWSAPKDITPTGVDCLFASLCNDVVNGRMYMAYTADETPGDRVSNPELPVTQTGIYFEAYPTAQLNPLVGVEEEMQYSGAALSEAYPNPASGSIELPFSIERAIETKIELYTVVGEKVATLQSGMTAPGFHAVVLNTENLAAGAYYYTLTAGTTKLTKMLSVVR